MLGFLPLSFSCWRVVPSACTGSSDNHGEGEVESEYSLRKRMKYWRDISGRVGR